jgi:hypothetical protein
MKEEFFRHGAPGHHGPHGPGGDAPSPHA